MGFRDTLVTGPFERVQGFGSLGLGFSGAVLQLAKRAGGFQYCQALNGYEHRIDDALPDGSLACECKAPETQVQILRPLKHLGFVDCG